MKKLAVVTSHPIQYNAPWFRHVGAGREVAIKVFYLWDFGFGKHVDPGFQRAVTWDVPLLDGYEHELVPNVSADPGTHHFFGLQNPSLGRRVRAFDPDAVLMLTYNYASTHRFLWTWRSSPLLFRGDSHRLVPPPPGPRTWARRAALGLTFRRFAAFLYVGQANRRYFQEHGVPEGRLFFAPHAVDNRRFVAAREEASREALAWRRELGIGDDEVVALFAGKIEPKKRVGDLVRAFARAGVDRSVLLIVGSGPLEAEVRALAAGHPGIRFAPFQNQTQMPRAYAAADVLVLPSFGPMETWGLSVNEAMCLARPAIVSSHVGCAEDLVHPGRNGWIFPAGDVPALAEALRDALGDRARLRAWGEESLRIVSRYSYAETTEGLLQALHHVERRPARGGAREAEGRA
jgi:glycosyltransferase involved in cell wall biosynthesis